MLETLILSSPDSCSTCPDVLSLALKFSIVIIYATIKKLSAAFCFYTVYKYNFVLNCSRLFTQVSHILCFAGIHEVSDSDETNLTCGGLVLSRFTSNWYCINLKYLEQGCLCNGDANYLHVLTAGNAKRCCSDKDISKCYLPEQLSYQGQSSPWCWCWNWNSFTFLCKGRS